MDSNEFLTLAKQGNLTGAYLLYGEEKYALNASVNIIKGSISLPDFNINYLDNPTAQTLMDVCEGYPVMGEKRLVLVQNSEFFSVNKAQEGDEKEKQPHKELCAYIENLMPTTLLIFIEQNANKTKALYKALNTKARAVPFLQYSQEQAANWLSNFASKRGSVLPKDIAMTIVLMAGADLTLLENECNKVCDMAGDLAVTREMVNKLVHRNLDFQVFEMLNSFSAGRIDQAMHDLNAAFSQKEPVIKLIGLFAFQMRGLYKARLGLDSKISEEKLATMLTEKGKSTYGAKQRIKQARSFTAKQLEQAIKLLAKADSDIKSTSRIDTLILEKTLIEIFAHS